jgi:peptidoglycan/xylan/chitin deacetylase (PgdA/CDA1 family)
MHKALVYHTICAHDAPLAADIDISPGRFEAHMLWLSGRRNKVVTLRRTLSAPLGEDLIAITFDDGYRDNLTVALPILERYQLPMTLFVAAGFIGKEGYVTADDLRIMASHPLVTIGSHGFSHSHLTTLSTADARFELAKSKKVLEEITNSEIDLLAYPYGDCNSEIEELSKECGYKAAWSVWNGTNSEFSRWRVPLGRNDNLLRLAAKISPLYFPVKKYLKPVAVSVPESTTTCTVSSDIGKSHC